MDRKQRYRKIKIGRRVYRVDMVIARSLWQQVRTFLFYAMLAGIGILAFKALNAYATLERGYIAVGGEAGLLLLPLLWWLISTTVKDSIRDVAGIFGGRGSAANNHHLRRKRKYAGKQE